MVKLTAVDFALGPWRPGIGGQGTAKRGESPDSKDANNTRVIYI